MVDSLQGGKDATHEMMIAMYALQFAAKQTVVKSEERPREGGAGATYSHDSQSLVAFHLFCSAPVVVNVPRGAKQTPF